MTPSGPVFSTSLDAAITQAVAALPPALTGQVTAGVTLDGAEVTFVWRPRTHLTLSGYGKRLWTGTAEAGARATFGW